MKKTRKLFPILLLTGLLTLSGCSLFNDDDIAISNSYNPKTSQSEEEGGVLVEGVRATTREETGEDVKYFRSICYAVDGKVENTYKADGGVNYTEYNVNGGNDYEGNVTKFNYDLYVPDSASRTGKHTVILFIHGGAWVSGFKMQVNPYVQEFARRGYVTATIKYTLLKKEMNDSSLSIFRNLDEIDACIKSIKRALEDEDLGFDTTKTELVIGGASSGSHLAMLYSYSRGDAAALPIKFIVDAVGPVNIKPECWKRFTAANEEEYQALVDAGVEYDNIQAAQASGNIASLGIAGFTYNWNEYQTMRIANGMCGIPYSLEDVEASTDENKEAIVNPNPASDSMTKAGGGEDQLSVTYWMSPSNRIPMICAYAGKDPIVGINQFATLQNKMESLGMVKGTNYEYFYFTNSSHEQITADADPTVYSQFIQKVDDWCQADF